jgi:cholesterol oxidase
MVDPSHRNEDTYDFVVIGSGFGGSVSAMRLTEKGYRVLVLERGRRFEDQDFPRSNWDLRNFLWMPSVRCSGFFEMSLLRGVMVLHWSGVGGGSLGYANVLIEPDDKMFESQAWRHLKDWKGVLLPYFEVAKRMLGSATNPRFTPADELIQSIAEKMGKGSTFRPSEVGVFFGEPNVEIPDPYFSGIGPSRSGCNFCGGCMIGCRYNAKNTLLKNYLYFAEKWGVEVMAESEVTEIRPIGNENLGGSRYEVLYKSSTSFFGKSISKVRTRNIVLSAGVLGTLKLLLHCRDEIQTLPMLSMRLGDNVRTNNEALLGVSSRDKGVNHTEGIAIGSVFEADEVTHIEPFRYPDGSSFLYRFFGAPLIEAGNAGIGRRLLMLTMKILRQPLVFLESKLIPGWGRRSFAVLVMQTGDHQMRLRLGRNLITLFRRGLISESDEEKPVPAEIQIGHDVTRAIAAEMNGVPFGNFVEGLLNMPFTAHILGGCPIGLNEETGVVGLNFEVHNYPGIYIIDGSIVPANPGLNPSLTITALAEYAMSRMPKKEGAQQRPQLGIN